MNSSGKFSRGTKMAPYFTTAEIVVVATVLVILIILAFLGNVLTCVVFFRKPQLRTPTNVSIIVLAITDVLSAVLVMPFSLASLISGKWIWGQTFCLFNAYWLNALLGLTRLSMLSTAVIRYLCVARASLHHHLKPKRTITLILTLWFLYLVLIAIPGFVEFPEARYSVKRTFCRLHYDERKPFKTVRVILLILAAILSTIMFIAYYRVFRFVSRHNNAVAPSLQHGMSTNIEEAKITKAFVIVVLAFVLCWIPAGIIEAITAIQTKSKISLFFRFLQTLFIFSSSAINPLIYNVTNRRFKREHLEVIRSLLPK